MFSIGHKLELAFITMRHLATRSSPQGVFYKGHGLFLISKCCEKVDRKKFMAFWLAAVGKFWQKHVLSLVFDNLHTAHCVYILTDNHMMLIDWVLGGRALLRGKPIPDNSWLAHSSQASDRAASGTRNQQEPGCARLKLGHVIGISPWRVSNPDIYMSLRLGL